MLMTLPGMTEFSDINLLFLHFYRDARDIFLEDVEIESVYGGFPGCDLCGGRVTMGDRMELAQIESLISRYRDLGVACNATFSNSLLDASAIEVDRYGLGILRLLDESSSDHRQSAAAGAQPASNGAIVYSDGLNQLIKSRFPHIIRIASTTKALTTKEAVSDALSQYDRVVLDYCFTKDEEAIASLPERHRLEIMANEYCTPGCPFRADHYKAASSAQIDGGPVRFRCRHKPGPQAWGFLPGLIDGSVFLKNEDLRRYEQDLGVRHFKIVGRGLARYDIIDSYLYYLVKPENWYEVRDYLIHRGYL